MTKNPSKKAIRVIIVGGGIGGLMLGIMLEKAGIDYQILERSTEYRPLGSAITLNGTVLRLFEQLELLEDIHKVSKFAGRLHLVKEDLETQGHVDLEHFAERYGYHSVVIGRPDLFKVLVSHILPGRLHMGKRVLSTNQTEFSVVVRCSDGSSFRGDILVGADGAYSSIRQCMHKSLKEIGLMHKSDSEKLKFDQQCVVGITDELSPEKFPILKEKHSEIYGIVGNKKPYTVWMSPISGNRFAWTIGGRVIGAEAGHEDFRSFSFAEWFPEHASDVCDLVRDYNMPNYNGSYKKDEHYKNPSLSNVAHPYEYNHFGELASASDVSSCYSMAPSDTSQSSTYCSSLYPEENVSRLSRSNSTKSKWRLSLLFSPIAPIAPFAPMAPLQPFTPLVETPKRDEILSRSANTSVTSCATENYQGFAQKRKALPARPGTVGEIIDATRPDRISKVMLQSKLYKVWHHGRTVLLGDACHKVLPFAGQGAIQAILDGVSLANALYDMESNTIDDVTKAFNRYTTERIPVARMAVKGSRSFGKLVNIQGKLSNFIRKFSFRNVPNWLLRMVTDKLHLHRPQLTFLPMIPDRGTEKAPEQQYSRKYLDRLVRRSQITERLLSSVLADSSFAQRATSFDKSRSSHSSFDDRERVLSKSHIRFQPWMLESLENKPMPSLPMAPPPLPSEAAPQHHPDVNVPILSDEEMSQIPLYSRPNSPQPSPAASSYSLGHVNTIPEEIVRPQSPTRIRRHQNGRGRSSSSKSLNQETFYPPSSHPLPPTPPLPLKIITDHAAFSSHSVLHLRSFDGNNVHQNKNNNGFVSQPYSPPRSPLSTTPPVNFNELNSYSTKGLPTCPPVTSYKRSHKRTKSLQLDTSLTSSLLALEQTAAMMKGRSTLREQRSLDQLNTSQQQKRQRY